MSTEKTPATFVDELQAFAATGNDILVRATAIASLRKQRGRQLGSQTRTEIAAITATLTNLAHALKSLAEPDETSDAVRAEFERFHHLSERTP